MRVGIDARDRRISGVIRIDDMSEEELLELLGGEPSDAELSAAAGIGPIGHAYRDGHV